MPGHNLNNVKVLKAVCWTVFIDSLFLDFTQVQDVGELLGALF